MNAPAFDGVSHHYRIRFLQPDDSTIVRGLFHKVFGKEMSEVLWRWKYARKESRAVLVFQGDRLVAHYGGIGINTCHEGRDGTAIQITDVMVDPEVRHAVRTGSPFFLAGKTFLENFIGYETPFLLGYGFPSDRHMRLAGILGLYAPVGNMWEVNWTPGETKNHPSLSFWDKKITVTAENFPRLRPAIDRLWERFKTQFTGKIICRKDADYFKKRFLEYPKEGYSLILITNRVTSKPKALLAFCQDGNNGMLMDLLCAPGKVKTALNYALALAGSMGMEKLTTWCGETFRQDFAVRNAELKQLPVVTPANIWSQGPPPEELNNKWWLMPGDTDYL